MRIAGGCRLDRDAVRIITDAGFELESVTPHAGGYVLEIVARFGRETTPSTGSEPG
jgi:hypothetical protein